MYAHATGEAKRDPELLKRGETTRITHPLYEDAASDVYGSGLPIRMSGSSVGYDRAAVPMGTHNEEIYGRLLGYSREKIEELKAKGII